MALAEKLKIQGIPTIFAIQESGDLLAVYPAEEKDFDKILDDMKETKPVGKC